MENFQFRGYTGEKEPAKETETEDRKVRETS